ncbi:MAG: PAS domain S-box protein [Pseudomonadota bacterium]|nr:PAS domain S-box protein [Pseudomonadota bacterium]
MLVATFVVATVALHLVREKLRASIQDEQFQRLAAIGDVIDQKFLGRRILLQTFARGVEAARLRDSGALQGYLDLHQPLAQAFDKVSFIDREGKLVANLNAAQQNGRVDIKDRPYFIDTVATKAGVISQPVRNRLSGQPQVVMTQPVFDAKGDVVYVLTAAINLQEKNFLGEFADVKFGRTGYMFILNTDGIVVDHPRKSRILKREDADGIRNPASVLALSGFEGTTETTNRYGVHGLYSFKRIRQTNWILGSIYPVDEAFEPIERVEFMAWIGAGFLALLGGGMTLLVLRVNLEPLERLGAHMRHVRDAQTYVPPELTFGNDEIGQLAATFSDLMKQRQLAQNALEASHNHFRAVLTHAADAFISLDRSGKITEWNRQAELTFGWSREEALGQSLPELIIPSHLRAAHHNGMQSFERSGRGPVVNARVEVTALTRTGHLIPIELSVAAVDMGDHFTANAFLRDISERKRVDDKLAQSERRLRTLADNMPALVSHIDLEFRYTYVNLPYLRWFSLDDDTLVGKTVREVFGDAAFESVRPHMEKAMGGKEVSFEMPSMVRGLSSYMLVHYVPDRNADGRVVGIYGMVLDMTERYEARALLGAGAARPGDDDGRRKQRASLAADIT